MADAGRHVPAIERRPSMTGWGWLWEAFWTLNTCRPIGMFAGPVPWTAVQRYAEVEELSRDETEMLHQVVRHLDGLLQDHHREKGEAKKTTSDRRPKRGVARS